MNTITQNMLVKTPQTLTKTQKKVIGYIALGILRGAIVATLYMIGSINGLI